MRATANYYYYYYFLIRECVAEKINEKTEENENEFLVTIGNGSIHNNSTRNYTPKRPKKANKTSPLRIKDTELDEAMSFPL